MIIDCTTCELQDSRACSDCLVTAVLSRRPESKLQITGEQQVAIKNLQETGLAPVLKFRRRAG